MRKVERVFWFSYGASECTRIGTPSRASVLSGVPRTVHRSRTTTGVPSLVVTSTIVPRSWARPTTSLWTSADGLAEGEPGLVPAGAVAVTVGVTVAVTGAPDGW